MNTLKVIDFNIMKKRKKEKDTKCFLCHNDPLQLNLMLDNSVIRKSKLLGILILNYFKLLFFFLTELTVCLLTKSIFKTVL